MKRIIRVSILMMLGLVGAYALADGSPVNLGKKVNPPQLTMLGK
jgi:hypothetical protein